MTPAAAEAGLMGVEGVAALTGWGSMTLLPPPPFCTSLFFTVVRLPTLSTLETPAHTPHFTDGPAAEPCTSVPLATRVQHGPGALGQALMPAALVAVAVGVNAPAPEGRGGACGGTWEAHECTTASDLGGILEAKWKLPRLHTEETPYTEWTPLLLRIDMNYDDGELMPSAALYVKVRS